MDQAGDESLNNKTIILNIGGTRFEAFAKYLPTSPKSVLHGLNSTSKRYRVETNDFFFDQDPNVFREVLNFYRTGELHVPLGVCGHRTKNELNFWGIDECNISGCCGAFYSNFSDQQGAYDKISNDLTSDRCDLLNSFRSKFVNKVWTVLNSPGSSPQATAYTVFVSLVSIALIISTILASMPQFHHLVAVNGTQSVNQSRGNNTSSFDVTIAELTIFEIVCVAILTVDLLLRFIFCPSKRLFCKSVCNIVDLLSIAPFYVNYIILAASSLSADSIELVLTIGKVFQIMRIFRVIKYYSAFVLLLYAVTTSLTEIALFVITIGTGVVVYSSLIHYAEPQTFQDIPTSCWWAVVTMTTVGYGDVYPTTAWGYIVGTLCAMSGLLVVAFTVPVLVNNFILYYTQMQLVQKHRKWRNKKYSINASMGPDNAWSMLSPGNLPGMSLANPTSASFKVSYLDVHNST